MLDQCVAVKLVDVLHDLFDDFRIYCMHLVNEGKQHVFLFLAWVVQLSFFLTTKVHQWTHVLIEPSQELPAVQECSEKVNFDFESKARRLKEATNRARSILD